MGSRCCDNCLYFANYVAETHPEKEIIWISKEDTDMSLLSPRVKKCVLGSEESSDYLKNAGAVFINQSINDLLSKDKLKLYYSGALRINFWHGVPWKKIHCDMNKKPLERAYIAFITKMYAGNVYLSTSDVYSTIIHTAFNCKEKNIIKSGMPRNSLFYDTDKLKRSKEGLMSFVSNLGMKISEETKIITYMPTFRDYTPSAFTIVDLMKNNKLQNILEQYNAIIIQKSHFVTSSTVTSNFNVSGRFLQIKDYPSQELLAGTDILITDYSSCFFDFLLLDRPIIHFLYDYDYYKNDDRGLYFPKEDVVCGDVVTNEDELIESVSRLLRMEDNMLSLRQKRREKYMQFESKRACDQIYYNIESRLS